MYSLSKKEIVAVSAGLGVGGHSVMAGVEILSAGVLGYIAYIGAIDKEPSFRGIATLSALVLISLVESGLHIANAVDAA